MTIYVQIVKSEGEAILRGPNLEVKIWSEDKREIHRKAIEIAGKDVEAVRFTEYDNYEMLKDNKSNLEYIIWTRLRSEA